MASTPQFPATPRLGIATLTDDTLTTVLSAGESGTYVEKLRYACVSSESVTLKIFVSDGTNDCLILTTSLAQYGSVSLDFAIPSGASIKVQLSSTPSGAVYVSVFGGDY